MADNYLQFSEEITNLTEAEEKWWRDKLAELKSYNEMDDPTEEQEYLGYCYNYFRIAPKRRLEPVEGGGEFVLYAIWVISEESGDIELVADIVQEFLKAHRPNEYWTATWACTCSKPRIGEFSGGGVFVSAEDIQLFSPRIQIQEAIKKHEARQVE